MTPPSPPDEHEPSAVTALAEGRPAGEPLPAWARILTRLLDDLLRIPGTEQGVGLDALLGLIPGVGDTVTGLGSMALLVLALRKRVPTVVLVKMLANIGVDVLTGTVPVLGDLFDVAFRSNRRNLDLIEKHAYGKEEPSTGDYVLVGGGLLIAAAAVATPFVISGLVGFSLVRWLTGS
ncbi:MAG: DUF4112 domain-containing protein [Polyangiales bacterium]|nr:DUF4112 domain-containing protein [Myxococcales bacterium]